MKLRILRVLGITGMFSVLLASSVFASQSVDVVSTPYSGVSQAIYESLVKNSVILPEHSVIEHTTIEKVTTIPVAPVERKTIINEDLEPVYDICYTGYVSAQSGLNVRSEMDINSSVVSILGFNSKVEYSKTENSDWYYTGDGFISAKYVADAPIAYRSIIMPYTRGFKSYSGFSSSLYSHNSRQYKLQCQCTTNNEGFRVYNGRYCVAVGTAVSEHIGQFIDVVLENGTVIPCVLADVKANCHTDVSNLVTVHNNCVSEFVVSKSSLCKNSLCMGDCSYSYPNWKSRVVECRVYNEYAAGFEEV